jgi:hypothetical protein
MTVCFFKKWFDAVSEKALPRSAINLLKSSSFWQLITMQDICLRASGRVGNAQ